MVPGRHSKDPLHLAYIKRLGRLSEEDRSDLVRVINQMLNSLPAHSSAGSGVSLTSIPLANLT
jgi:hypothetical protein